MNDYDRPPWDLRTSDCFHVDSRTSDCSMSGLRTSYSSSLDSGTSDCSASDSRTSVYLPSDSRTSDCLPSDSRSSDCSSLDSRIFWVTCNLYHHEETKKETWMESENHIVHLYPWLCAHNMLKRDQITQKYIHIINTRKDRNQFQHEKANIISIRRLELIQTLLCLRMRTRVYLKD